MGPAISFLAEYPLTTYPLFAPARVGLAIHPGVGIATAAGISGYLGMKNFIQLISDEQTLKNIGERKEPLFFK